MNKLFSFEVRYQDVDMHQRLRLSVLETMLLWAAGLEVEERGWGLKRLYPLGLTWILNHITIVMDYLPTTFETVGIETWISSNAHMLSTRNFRVFLIKEDGTKQEIGQGTSIWTVLDMKTRKIVNIFDWPEAKEYPLGEPLEIARHERFTPLTAPDGSWQHTITFSDMDYNGHCNSCKYLEFFVNARPQIINEIIANPHFRIDIDYTHEVVQDEQTVVLYQRIDNALRFQLNTQSGEIACKAKIALL